MMKSGAKNHKDFDDDNDDSYSSESSGEEWVDQAPPVAFGGSRWRTVPAAAPGPYPHPGRKNLPAVQTRALYKRTSGPRSPSPPRSSLTLDERRRHAGIDPNFPGVVTVVPVERFPFLLGRIMDELRKTPFVPPTFVPPEPPTAPVTATNTSATSTAPTETTTALVTQPLATELPPTAAVAQSEGKASELETLSSPHPPPLPPKPHHPPDPALLSAPPDTSATETPSEQPQRAVAADTPTAPLATADAGADATSSAPVPVQTETLANPISAAPAPPSDTTSAPIPPLVTPAEPTEPPPDSTEGKDKSVSATVGELLSPANLKAVPTYDPYELQNILISASLDEDRFDMEHPDVETHLCDYVIEQARSRAHSRNRIAEVGVGVGPPARRDQLSVGERDTYVLALYNATLSGTRDKRLRQTYRHSEEYRHQWTPEELERFEQAYRIHGNGPVANRRIADYIGGSVRPSHVAFLKSQRRKLSRASNAAPPRKRSQPGTSSTAVTSSSAPVTSPPKERSPSPPPIETMQKAINEFERQNSELKQAEPPPGVDLKRPETWVGERVRVWYQNVRRYWTGKILSWNSATGEFTIDWGHEGITDTPLAAADLTDNPANENRWTFLNVRSSGVFLSSTRLVGRSMATPKRAPVALVDDPEKLFRSQKKKKTAPTMSTSGELSIASPSTPHEVLSAPPDASSAPAPPPQQPEQAQF